MGLRTCFDRTRKWARGRSGAVGSKVADGFCARRTSRYSDPSVVARARRLAPLAQSAERFHGKEKVVSSILTGGSQISKRVAQGESPRSTRSKPCGGVAQSVRALDS